MDARAFLALIGSLFRRWRVRYGKHAQARRHKGRHEQREVDEGDNAQ